MVNNSAEPTHPLVWTTRLVAVYVVIVVATLSLLTLLSSRGSAQATSEAWGHAVVVGVFAVLLPVRLRAARRGRPGATRAVGIIAGVLTVVNVVEAAIPHLFPAWMRIEMGGIAVLMLAVVLSVVRHERLRAGSDVAAAADPRSQTAV